jgi:hypothetical protein
MKAPEVRPTPENLPSRRWRCPPPAGTVMSCLGIGPKLQAEAHQYRALERTSARTPRLWTGGWPALSNRWVAFLDGRGSLKPLSLVPILHVTGNVLGVSPAPLPQGGVLGEPPSSSGSVRGRRASRTATVAPSRGVVTPAFEPRAVMRSASASIMRAPICSSVACMRWACTRVS